MSISTNKNTDSLKSLFGRIRIQRGLAWGLIITCALIAFEVFNYSTTDFALKDVLGDLNFIGLRWSTILALAFCGIDFAGIARLFTPEKGKDEPAEVWYLFGAWLIAATMNAMLTWRGVSVAIFENTQLSSNLVVSSATMTRVVPIFIALMVWLIRVLIIGTFSVSGERLFSQGDEKAHFRLSNQIPLSSRSFSNRSHPGQSQNQTPSYQVAPKSRIETGFPRPEPSYHNISMNTQSRRDGSVSETRQ